MVLFIFFLLLVIESCLLNFLKYNPSDSLFKDMCQYQCKSLLKANPPNGVNFFAVLEIALGGVNHFYIKNFVGIVVWNVII